MRVILIEDTVYQVSEEEFQEIKETERQANNLPFGTDLHIDEVLHFEKENYKLIGVVDFEFRL